MVGSLTGAVALTNQLHILRKNTDLGRIWLYAGTSGVSGGTRVAFGRRSENPTGADNQQGRPWEKSLGTLNDYTPNSVYNREDIV